MGQIRKVPGTQLVVIKWQFLYECTRLDHIKHQSMEGGPGLCSHTGSQSKGSEDLNSCYWAPLPIKAGSGHSLCSPCRASTGQSLLPPDPTSTVGVSNTQVSARSKSPTT